MNKAIHETELPGVGKKFQLDLLSGLQLALILYNNGRREIHLLDEEGDSQFHITLTEEEAHQIAMLLAGTVYNPISTDKAQLLLQEMVIEWIPVKENSPLAHKTIAQSEVRRKTGSSILAIIQKDNRIYPSPDPYQTIIEVGDTLIAAGTRIQIQNLSALAQGI